MNTELIMSLLKNILIAGLFFSVFVAVSPAFAETLNKNNQVILCEDLLSVQNSSDMKIISKVNFK
tara:strand:- start:435 stop:629 length:195 start_codon:yes stop_codon:yes gene_type:complete